MKLANYIKQIRGVSYKPADILDHDEDGYIPLLRANNIKDGIINFDNLVYVNREKVKKEQIMQYGDILVCTSSGSKDLVGKAGTFRSNDEYTFGAFCKVIRAVDIDNEYLSCYFQSQYYRKTISQNSRGANINNLKQENFDDLNINIPRTDEQAKISNQLRMLFDLIIKKKEQISKCNDLIKYYFIDIFKNNDYPKEELGKICDVRDGTHDSPKYFEKTEYKFITSKNIVNNEIDFSEVKYISKEDYDKFNIRSKVNYGDILMPMIGTIGNPIIVNIPDEKIDFAIKNVALIKFLNNSKVTNIYIQNLFNSDYFENTILQNKRGGTQKFVSLSDIRKLEIEIPPMELQNKFAKFVKQVEKNKYECEKSLKRIEEMQSALMQEYFG